MPFGRSLVIAVLISRFSYLADFPHLGAAEAVICEGMVTECEVRDVLKLVGLAMT